MPTKTSNCARYNYKKVGRYQIKDAEAISMRLKG
jgi:hypothetical protein